MNPLRVADTKLDWRSLPFATSTASAPWLERCRCADCLRHDLQLENELRRKRDAYELHWSRVHNYLEPTIRRLDEVIARVRKYAA